MFLLSFILLLPALRFVHSARGWASTEGQDSDCALEMKQIKSAKLDNKGHPKAVRTFFLQYARPGSF